MAATGLQIVTQALTTLGVFQPGAAIPTNTRDDCFLVLQKRWDSLSRDPLISNVRNHASFALTPTITAYTVGPAGTFSTPVPAIRVTGWQCVSGNFRSGGKVVSFEEFDAIAKDPLGSSATLVSVVAADASYPAKNIRVFPVPAAASTLILEYQGAMPALADINASIVDDNYVDLAHYDLAFGLYARYARQSTTTLEAIAGARKIAYETIAGLNAGIDGLIAQPAQ